MVSAEFQHHQASRFSVLVTRYKFLLNPQRTVRRLNL